MRDAAVARSGTARPRRHLPVTVYHARRGAYITGTVKSGEDAQLSTKTSTREITTLCNGKTFLISKRDDVFRNLSPTYLEDTNVDERTNDRGKGGKRGTRRSGFRGDGGSRRRRRSGVCTACPCHPMTDLCGQVTDVADAALVGRRQGHATHTHTAPVIEKLTGCLPETALSALCSLLSAQIELHFRVHC